MTGGKLVPQRLLFLRPDDFHGAHQSSARDVVTGPALGTESVLEGGNASAAQVAVDAAADPLKLASTLVQEMRRRSSHPLPELNELFGSRQSAERARRNSAESSRHASTSREPALVSRGLRDALSQELVPRAENAPTATACAASVAAESQLTGISEADRGTSLDSAAQYANAAADIPQQPVDLTAAGLTGHYEPGTDVLLRLEYATPGQTRLVVLFMWGSIMASAVFLILEFTWKFTDPDAVENQFAIPILNLCVAPVCFCMTSWCLGKWLRRLVSNRRNRRTWRIRRWRLTMWNHAELICHWVNLIMYTLPNAYLQTSWCHFFHLIVPWTSLVSWTCWNTIFLISVITARNNCMWRFHRPRKPAADALHVVSAEECEKACAQEAVRAAESHEEIYLEAPVWVHWPLGLVWLCCQASTLLCIIRYADGKGGGPAGSAEIIPPGIAPWDCRRFIFNCKTNDIQTAIIGIMVFWPVVYFFLFAFYLRLAFVQLKSKPYQDFRTANLLVRLEVRLRLAMFTFFIISIATLNFVRYARCWSYLDMWLGLLPHFTAETASVTAWSFLTMPKLPGGKPKLLQVWLQEFAWSEVNKREHKAARDMSSGPGGHQQDNQRLQAELQAEPMFCFETAMNMLYWSALVYDCDEVIATKVSMREGMSLYGLRDAQLFIEQSCDTKMIMAWNPTTIVMSFRGTASRTAAFYDMQAWLAVHDPARGEVWAKPKVHRGFQRCWLANDFNLRVKQHILGLLQQGALQRGKVKLYVTGHSLGGALATLAAYSLRHMEDEHGPLELRVCCYTFGAPRTGNHPFAREFDEKIPDTWNIINDQDLVPRAGKLVVFKRAGQRVLINQFGDMLVRPPPIEASMRQIPGGVSVRHHLLTAYTHSFLAVLLSQFSGKRFPGAMIGVTELVERCIPIQRLLLGVVGISYLDLKMLSCADDQICKEQCKKLMQASSFSKRRGLRRPCLTSLLLCDSCCDVTFTLGDALALEGDAEDIKSAINPASTAADAPPGVSPEVIIMTNLTDESARNVSQSLPPAL